MKIILLIVNILLALTAIAYPIIWLFFQADQLLHTLPYVMSLLWLIKSLIHPHKGQRIFALSMAILLFLVGWQRSLDMMYWYPILMNGIMLVLFGGSLFQSQSLVERLARLQSQYSSYSIYSPSNPSLVRCILFKYFAFNALYCI